MIKREFYKIGRIFIHWEKASTWEPLEHLKTAKDVRGIGAFKSISKKFVKQEKI